jgi:hypothetical protein
MKPFALNCVEWNVNIKSPPAIKSTTKINTSLCLIEQLSITFKLSCMLGNMDYFLSFLMNFMACGFNIMYLQVSLVWITVKILRWISQLWIWSLYIYKLIYSCIFKYVCTISCNNSIKQSLWFHFLISTTCSSSLVAKNISYSVHVLKHFLIS